ncbi:PQQ-binding-like beta-propeller repeat protein [Chungangia koreensis]|uniref:PQQ-binding-like beta-propeller repeat protein n=1 Tax=Chungangia koreensis TaxID=752657 RepID=A0ABV8X684_9LACT
MKSNAGTYKSIFIGAIILIFALIILLFVSKMVTTDEGSEEDTDQVEQTSDVSNDKGENAPKANPDVKVEYPTSNWTTHGGDYYNRRYSALEQVNVENIKDLKPQWVTSLGSGLEFKYSGEATPLVEDGIMYIATGANDVLALEAVTGEKIWEYRPELAEGLDTVCCGWTTRGVAIGDDKIYVGLLDARLVALDKTTGEVVWEREVANWEEGYTITSAPLYYDGKVFTGVAGGEYGIKGRMTAYDSDNGIEVWRWSSIPGPGEQGHDTWPEDSDAYLTGGAPIWQTPAVDPELGMIYFATGNTSPDLDGSGREGDNLYANSVVALDVNTGNYQWHFQEVHHDIWDMDPANPVILYDVEMDGEKKKGIGQAGKTGWLYLLDRTNGEPLVGIEEKEVPQMEEQKTSPTQPFPVGDAFVPQEVTKEDVERDLGPEFEGEIGGIFTPFWDVPITLKPGPQGGANWPPSSFNPDTEYYYILGNDGYFSFERSEQEEYKEGDQYLGSIFGPVLDAPQRGTVTAIDVKTNKIAWQQKWDAIAYSGILTTKGNLLFTGHNDGRLIAYDAKTGDQVWEFMTDAGVNAPPITYEVAGEQYISVFAAGNSLAGTKHGDKVYTFKLNGDLKEGTVIDASEGKSASGKAPQKDDAEANADSDAGKVEADQGLAIYEANCLACHGEQGASGHNGPNLQDSPITPDKNAVIERIKNGGASMPSFEGTLSEEEIQAVADYVTDVLSPMSKE